jgi:polyisoprenoid-binding protein YceI
MKTIRTFLLAFIALVTISAAAQTRKKVDVTKSKINWVGKKVLGEHSGTIKLRDGVLLFKGKELNGGSFTVDMTSITVTDLKAGEGKEDLEGHLKNKDFFGVEKYDAATLAITSATSKGNGTYAIKGNMTIKGITNPIGFDMTLSGNTAKAKLVIDRTKYDIKYGSGSFFTDLGNKAINDEFELTVSLTY